MNDYDYIREKVESENISLPTSLERAEIEQKLSSVKPKKRKKAKIIAFTVPAAAALFLAFTFFILPNVSIVSRYIPKNGTFHAQNEQSLGFQSYDSIADQLTEIKTAYEKDRKENTHYRLSFGSRAKYTADYDFVENAADAPAAAASSPTMSASKSAMNSVAEEASYVAADGTGEEKAHSDTNLRDAAVDEQDIVKTDGEYIYYLPSNGTTVYIVRADGEKLLKVSEIKHRADASKYHDYFSGMFIAGDTLVVTGSESFENPQGYSDTYTSVRLYDITDRSTPKELNSFRFKGYSESSRLIGNKLISVTSSGLNLYSFRKNDISTYVPCYYCGTQENYVDAADIILPENTTPDGFISVFTLDLTNPAQSEPETVSVMTCGASVYCTQSTLYVYSMQYDYSNDNKDLTQIISFDISGDKAAFIAKGMIDGSIGDSFAIDEFGGYLRVAVTECTYGYEFKRVCRVVVLDRELNKVGATDGIAENESVRSVRFMGNTAYVVTFLNTDPLFVIDLSDPTAPVIKGEVKLPGFSAYLHPIADNLLIGIGSGGTETGTDGSAKVSLFDVSDPTQPKEVNNLVFKESYLNTDYKAFVDLKDGTYLAGITEYSDDYEHFVVSLIRFGLRNGELALLTRYRVNSDDYSYGNEPRGLFIGDTVYAAASTERWDYPDEAYYNDVTGGYIYVEDDTDVYADELDTMTTPVYEPTYQRIDYINAYDKESGALIGSITLYEGEE
ncbi:MAG: beta-propeller domain-containing protein [Clostridia bacterium]|nr:beta-propeller domain-containing protein [Clostridia bacterium]